MGSYDNFQDLLYLSQTKVENLYSTLKVPLARRLSAIELTVLEAGLRTELRTDTSSAAAKLPLVVDAVIRNYLVKDFTDPRLRPGEWFLGDLEQMAYGRGQWDWAMDDEGVVFFSGSAHNVDVLLGGSVQHLLDRELPSAQARTGSSSERLRATMAKVIAIEEAAGDPGSLSPVRWEGDLADSARTSFFCIDRDLAQSAGRAPLTFLARAIQVVPAGPDTRALVLGTPLYVAFLRDEHTLPATSFDYHQGDRDQVPERRGAWSRISPFLSWLGIRPQGDLGRTDDPQAVDSVEDSRPAHAASQAPVSSAPSPTGRDSPPSLDIALYIGPSSAGRFSSTTEYYNAFPQVLMDRREAAVGNVDFPSSSLHWFDDQGGAWVVAFSCPPVPGSLVPLGRAAKVRGNLVATAVGPRGAGEVLVLRADLALEEAHECLRGHWHAEPYLTWVVNHL